MNRFRDGPLHIGKTPGSFSRRFVFPSLTRSVSKKQASRYNGIPFIPSHSPPKALEKRRLGGEGATLHQKDVPLPANTDFSYPSPLTPLAVLRMARVTALELFLQIGIFRHSLLMAAHAGLFGLLVVHGEVAVSYTHLTLPTIA